LLIPYNNSLEKHFYFRWFPTKSR